MCSSWLTRRIRLTVAYDGTDFCGWAAQPGRRTVQGTLTDAVRQVSGEECEIVGASRTDSGAHARGQVAHFDTEVAIPIERWARALNRVLPPDLRIREASVAGSGFHSRFCADDRHYRYAIARRDDDPFLLRTAYGQRRDLDVDAMRVGAETLVGEHDFRAFTEELDPYVENTVRTLRSVSVWARRDRVDIDVVGTAFLRGMMRRMAGCLYEIGIGNRATETVEALLDPLRRDRVHGPVVLPACGLTLMRIRYGRWPRDNREKGQDGIVTD